jgi:hypothetical protein
MVEWKTLKGAEKDGSKVCEREKGMIFRTKKENILCFFYYT